MAKANRPVFIPKFGEGLVEELSVEFEWFGGFAVSQKHRCIQSLHQAALKEHRLSPILEVSTKSLERLGGLLSAFNLNVRCETHPDPILLEAAFQGSKVFKKAGGPFMDLFSLRSGREVKRCMREFADDQLTGFQFNGRQWPLIPKTAFYDWLYLRALRELDGRDEVDESLCRYQAFTDIEFNPKKSVNCQARSCALHVALLRWDGPDYFDRVDNPDEFLKMLKRRGYSVGSQTTATGPRQSYFDWGGSKGGNA